MRRFAPLLGALLLVSACERPASYDGLEREEFVATYVDLRRATVAGELDAQTRDSILEAHGTTEEALRDYIEQRAEDPEAIAETWREINERITARDTMSADDDTLGADTSSADPDSI